MMVDEQKKKEEILVDKEKKKERTCSQLNHENVWERFVDLLILYFGFSSRLQFSFSFHFYKFRVPKRDW